MSIPPGINLQKIHLSILYAPEHPPVAPAQVHAEERPPKIEQGIRLNSMQKEFLKKFQKMQSGARDLSVAFTQLPAENLLPVRCGLVQVKKISEK